MKYQIALITIVVLAELSNAQLLYPKKSESIPKIDSALVFRVNYGDVSAPIEDSQKEDEPTTEQYNGRSHSGFDIKSSLIWTGICATEAILSKGPSANSLCFRGKP